MASSMLSGVPASVIDGSHFDPAAEPLAIEGRRSFNFLSVFDWTLRKGWDLLLEAYVREFDAAEDVALILKPTSTAGLSLEHVASELEAQLIALTPDLGESPDIILQWVDIPLGLMPSLYRAADCFVLPSRAEGRGRALLEAQACGLPAIAPGSGVAGALLPAASPFRFESSRTTSTDPAGWAEPDIGDLRVKLRAAVADPARTRALGLEAARFVRQRFSAGTASVPAAPAAAPIPSVQPAAPSAQEECPMLDTSNTYTLMQRSYYERTADLMNEENHMLHNGNRDYWDILLADTLTGFRDKVGLDFGCGCGRNVMNIWNRFQRMDGVDLSFGNLVHARKNILALGVPEDAFKLYACNGTDLREVPSDEYDFVMSTIVLQHIAVHEIRLNYLREFFRIMRPLGLLSFQMGFGDGYGRAGYHENHYSAQGTNSAHDTTVTDPDQIGDELQALGFEAVTHVIRPSYSDGHRRWIYVKARKPAEAA